MPALLSGVVMLDNEGWSLYGAQRSQLVATGGKWEGAENGSDKRKPLPSVASSCLSRSMVRRGSTVRVRQRALQSLCKSAPFLPALLAELPTCARYGAVYGASRFWTASSSREIDAFRIRRAASSATWACCTAGRRRDEER